MPHEKTVFLKCQFAKAGFPSERVFILETPSGGRITGIAPAEYCFLPDRVTLAQEPPPGQPFSGVLAALEIGPDSVPGFSRVYLPNGQVYDVSSDLIDQKGAPTRVPVQS